MNKLIIGVILLVACLMALVVAPAVFETDRNREITTKQLQIATDKGISNYSYQDFIIDDTFQRCLISSSEFRLPCSKEFQSFEMLCDLWNETIYLFENNGTILNSVHSSEESEFSKIYSQEETFDFKMECLNEVRVNLTSPQMENNLDNWEEKTMNLILDNEEKRETLRNVTLVREGTVTQRKPSR